MHPSKEILIDREIAINVSNNSLTTASPTTSQLTSLHLLLELQVQNSPVSSKELLLQITDENEPLLLLSTIITESGYQSLRCSQGLLVDFNSFPHHFSDLIKRCVEEQQRESPKFVLVLRMSDNTNSSSNEGGVETMCLEVVELNAFKHLCHLSLNLRSASVQNKLSHLASGIRTLKKCVSVERDKFKSESLGLAEEVAALKERLSSKSNEMEFLREEMQQKMNFEVEKYSRMLKEEGEINLKTKSDCDRKMAREKRELESRLDDQSRKMRAENSSLRKRNAEISGAKEEIEAELRSTRQSLKESEEKTRRHTKELNGLAKERSDLKREAEDAVEDIRTLRLQLSKQGKTIEEMDRIIEHDSRQLAAFKQEKGLLDEQLDACQKKLEKREASIQTLVTDFQKSLDIINKFKLKIKDLSKENSLLVETLEAQRSSLEGSKESLRMSEEEREEAARRCSSLEEEVKGVKKALKEREEQAQEQERDLKRNENVIAWLNKQLNEMESTEALMRKAPLAEAYVQPHSIRASKFSGSLPTTTPSLTTSTPMSGYSAPPNFMGSAQSKIHSPGNAPQLKDIPKISEEMNSPAEDNKENCGGLDSRYLEPTPKPVPFPVRGILRANAVPKPIGRGAPAKPAVKAKPKKIPPTKQSNYFAN